MDSTENSLTDSLKSKKILHPKVNPSPSASPSAKSFRRHHDSNPWSTKTPEKPVDPPRRTRNRGSAFSLKEVREAARKLQKSDLNPIVRPDRLLAEQLPLSPVTKPKRPESSISLPEKYEMLDKLFHSLDSSIRLCRLKGTAATFTNVSPKIECLTDRRFTYSNLAQIKFILPEAIEIKKIWIRDDRTSCMKSDLLLSFDIKAVEDSKNAQLESGSNFLRKIFRSRLVDYFKAHPQDDEIPEEDLPDPFKSSKISNQINTPTFQESSIPTETPQPLNLPLISQSIRKSFSLKGITKVIRQEDIVKSGPSFPQMIPKKQCPLPESVSPSPKKLTPFETPVKHTITANPSIGTPVQSDSTPAKLNSATPMLAPPKRCYMTPDNDVTNSMKKLVRRPSRSRSLKFDNNTIEKSPEFDDDCEEKGCFSVDDDIFDVLPESLIRSIQEKEKKALTEKDPAISQAKRRKQMIAGLPKLFDTIYFLFQSIRRSVLTKEELLHKVVSSNLDILDTKEAEEQLRLLQELAPEWIYEKMASSGNSLLCVNKISSPDAIRSRIAEAI